MKEKQQKSYTSRADILNTPGTEDFSVAMDTIKKSGSSGL